MYHLLMVKVVVVVLRCVLCVSLIDGQGCCCCTQLRLYDTSYL